MSNIYTVDIASRGMQSYWKIDRNGWSGIISAYPIVPNATTIVEFYMENGNNFNFGCGKKHEALLRSKQSGHMPDTVGINFFYGHISRLANYDAFMTPGVEGDNITMIIDMHEDKEYLKYIRNGNDMGIAHSGLGDWGD